MRHPPSRFARLTSLLAILLAGGACALSSAQAPAEPLVVSLVRHAEKTEGGDDPELSAAGVTRAAELARALGDAGLEHVHSSDTVRTRATAAPIAEALGLEVELYDPGDLPALVERLRATPGRHLVVGHSNTTPAVVELLGGEPGPPIDEPGEYDRLYLVTLDGQGNASTVLLRYGAPYVPDPGG